MAQPSISLPLFVAAEDRRRFFLQAGKAAEKFAVKLIKPYAGNLVSYFLVKGKEEAARADVQYMEDFFRD